MIKWLVGIVAGMLVLGAILYFTILQGRNISRYEFLRAPRIVTLADQRVLEVEVKGDPDQLLPKAFSVLFSVYYQLKGVPKGPNQPAPRFRMPVPKDLPKSEWEQYFRQSDWIGYVAIPVPATVTTLPESAQKAALPVRLTSWTYGPVGEILHIGAYDQELPTIEKLEIWLSEQGYAATGIHEEEYLRGPGMPFTKPENYYTIIRYPVEKTR